MPPLTLTAAAERLGICDKTLRRLIAEKKIAAIRYTPKGKIYIDPEELERFKRDSTTKVTPAPEQRKIGIVIKDQLPSC